MSRIALVCGLGLLTLVSACADTRSSQVEAWAASRPAMGPSLDLLARGDAHFARREYAEAGRMYAQAAEAAGPPSAYVEACAQVARVWSLMGRPGEGEPWLRMAVARAQKKDPLGWSRLLLVIGIYEREGGNRELALARFEELYDYGLRNELYERSVDAAQQVLLTSQDPELQNTWSRKAIAAAEAGNLTAWLVRTWTERGASLEERGRDEDALFAYEEAREYRRRGGEEPGLRSAEHAVGRVLRKLGRMEEALEISRVVLPWAEACYAEDPTRERAAWLGFATWERAELDRVNGDPELALAELETARAKLIEAKIGSWRESGPQDLARIESRLAEWRGETP